MKFSKYNNPNRKIRKTRPNVFSPEYVADQKNQMYALLAQAKTEEEKDAIIKAYDVSMHPYRKGGSNNAY